MSFINALFGNQQQRAYKKFLPLVTAINSLEQHLSKLTDSEIRASFDSLKKLVISKEKNLDDLLPEVFAHVREASKRTLGQRHFDVQLIGGVALHTGSITEMKTGEGKTLVATLAAALNALPGQGVHIVTVNDYLARRDCAWMGKIYDFLGLTVGVIQHDAAFQFTKNVADGQEPLQSVSRKDAYRCDITYGTNNEYGFDYLRDNMAPTEEHMVQRNLSFCIIDEVDSILIDEARTPLIISAPSEASSGKYREFAIHVNALQEGTDYNVDEKMRAVTLTEEGIRKMENKLGIQNIYTAGGIETIHHIEQALRAKAMFFKDKDYVVKDGEIIIVDEFTGRLMFGRRYSEGLHQAIEAKENVDVQQENQTLATITFQNYFRMYSKLSGMTGTAATESEEFAKIYGLDVIVIPTNKPLIRNDQTDLIYKSEKGKFVAVLREVKRLHEKGQPVLIGTISIEKNEMMSALLTKDNIPHEILNAKNHEREAHIIANAGKKGAVTLATNMAGRGVDIVLGGTGSTKEDQVYIKELGGLFVIGTERHESRRIDNQLRGRSGRQGDAGASQFFVSLEDDLMRIFGSDRIKSMMERLGMPEDVPIQNTLISRSIETAQKKVEGHNFDIRKHLVEYDDVINTHRNAIYKKRRKILHASIESEGINEDIRKLFLEEIERVIQFHTSSERISEWDIDEIYEVLDSIFPTGLKTRLTLDDVIKDNKYNEHESRDAIIKYCTEVFTQTYDEFKKSIGDSKRANLIERAVYLRAIDSLWVEHLSLMDYLRQGIGLRGYGQRDPLVEYKKEAFKLFSELVENIRHQVVYSLMKVRVTTSEGMRQQNQNIVYSAPAKSSISNQFGNTQKQQHSQLSEQKRAPNKNRTPQGEKIGRNDPCWCGSGKKFKKCHGM